MRSGQFPFDERIVNLALRILTAPPERRNLAYDSLVGGGKVFLKIVRRKLIQDPDCHSAKRPLLLSQMSGPSFRVPFCP